MYIECKCTHVMPIYQELYLITCKLYISHTFEIRYMFFTRYHIVKPAANKMLANSGLTFRKTIIMKNHTEGFTPINIFVYLMKHLEK